MTDELVRTDVSEEIMHVRLARPEKLNALTDGMYAALADALKTASNDRTIRVMLLSSEGHAFCAGNDIADFMRFEGDFARSPQGAFVHALAHCRKPIVAAVQGAAVGIGTTMLLHCDLVYATANASFQAPFVDLGVVPEAGSTLLLPQWIGYQRAAAMLLLGEPLTAEQAATAGFVTEVVAPSVLLTRALRAAVALAGKPPEALAATRRLMRTCSGLAARMDEEALLFGRALAGAESKAAFRRFVERKPLRTS